MTSRGRKEDNIWQYFVKQTIVGKLGCRAVCKKCGKNIQGLVERLKTHWETCKNKNCSNNNDDESENINESQPKKQGKENEETLTAQHIKKQKINKSGSLSGSSSFDFGAGCSSNSDVLSSFVVRTSQDKKKELDKQIARAIFATNCSFRSIEHKEVRKAIEMLRPGYVPPSRFQLSSIILDEIFEDEKSKYCKNLSGKSVCMSLDGWSNIHNEPIICVVLTAEDGNSFLFESIDTSGHSHTSDYLADIAVDVINKCDTEFNCKVTSIVTDNAANMSSMRKKLSQLLNLKYPIITYGCSAHILNLLSKDLEIKQIKEHVLQIVKYFRNTHLPNAWYKQKGGKKLIVPHDVRWNTLSDCFETYVSEWSKLLEICEEHEGDIDPVIFKKVSNIQIKRMAEDFLKLLKPISVTLDRMQQRRACLSYAVEEWKKLEAVFTSFESTERIIKQKFVKRYEQATTPIHFLAYLLDPTTNKNEFPLSPQEKNSALEIVSKYYSGTGLLPLVIKLEAKSDPFHETMFSQEIIQNVNAVQWWRSQKNVPEINQALDIIVPILCASASSADVERTFSSYGLVHSELRNRLGNEKASKLVFLFKHYNTT